MFIVFIYLFIQVKHGAGVTMSLVSLVRGTLCTGGFLLPSLGLDPGDTPLSV